MLNPTNWEEAAKTDADKYIACVPSGLPYDASGLIDAGALIGQMRDYFKGYSFIGKDILEFGCGNGRMANHLRKYFGRYYACDISITMLDECENHLDDLDITIETDGKCIGLVDNTLDLLFTFTVLFHNKKADIPAIMKEFNRILKPGGIAFIQLSCYSKGIDRQETFNSVAIWTKEEIRKLAEESGFSIIEIYDAGREMGNQISDKHFKYHILKKL